MVDKQNQQDIIFDFKGYWDGASRCRLRCYAGPMGEAVVVATELEDNDGTSITNMAEHLATAVCQSRGIDPESLFWAEHYLDRRERFRDGTVDTSDTSGAESFDAVSFDLETTRDGQRFSEP